MNFHFLIKTVEQRTAETECDYWFVRSFFLSCFSAFILLRAKLVIDGRRRAHSRHCPLDATVTMQTNQYTSEKDDSTAAPVSISIRCISPASSDNESGLSEEDDVVDDDEIMRVWRTYARVRLPSVTFPSDST